MSKGIYLRVLPEESALDPARDLPVLEALVATCGERLPGVAFSKPTEPHPRGGYSLFLTCQPDQREAIVLFLRAEGWLSVI